MKILRWVLFVVLLMLWSFPAFGQARRIEKIQGHEVIGGEIIVRFRPTATGTLSSIRQDPDTISLDPLGRSGDVVIRSRQRTTAELLQAYSGRTDLEYAEPNRVWHKTDLPNDPLLAQQWALQNNGQVIQGAQGVPGADIRAVTAWNTTMGSRNIVVGVIDTGINYNHNDLSDNVWTAPVAFDVNISGQTIHCNAGTHGFNAIARTCDPMDDEGHGTAVAGVIGATGLNGIGITGVNRLSSVMALKFLDSTGSGSTTDAIAAIEFAIQVQTLLGVNIRVLNAGWGDTGFSQALMDEISSANNHNMLFVTSAGNETADNNSTPTYPANFNLANIVSVAATDNRDNLATFSNFGSSSVHLGAPGVNIISTEFRGGTAYFSGTSLASPMVAGAAALLLAACPQDTAGLKTSLLNNADRIPSLMGKTISGGRLNVLAAMNSCPGGVATFNLSANHTTTVGVRAISVDLTVAGNAGYSGNVQFSAFNLPTGATAIFNPPALVGSGTTTMTVLIPAGATSITYSFGVLASDGFISKTIGLNFIVPPQITVSQSTTPSLSPSDLQSVFHNGSFADYFQFTLSSPQSITIDMRSEVGPGLNTFLNLLSDAGTLISSDDNSGGGTSSRIGPLVLSPGTYIVEATAVPGQTGQYFLGINVPTLDSITPSTITAGTSVPLTFKGNGFLSFALVVGLFGGQYGLHVVDSQTLTGTIDINISSSPGTYRAQVITSSGAANLATNTIPVTVVLPPPVITSMSPMAVAPGNTLSFLFNGVGFATGMTVNAGNGITASFVNTNSSVAVLIQLTIAPGATLGVHNVTVTTPAGTSPPFPLLVTVSPPTLTGISKSTFNAGSSSNITVTGSNFTNDLKLQGDMGVSFSSVTAVTDTTATASIMIDSAASFGFHNIVAKTAQGTSSSVTITVTPTQPTLTSITPNLGGQGATTLVALTGSAFRVPLTLDVGAAGDITVTNLAITDTSHLTATLNIAGNAQIGNRNITVTTPGGTSTAGIFNVTPPFPDLAVTDITASNFFSGYPQTYSVTVRNVGSVPTSGTTTLTHNMGPTYTFSAASGPGWSCSISGGSATCQFTNAIPAGTSSTLSFTSTPANGITGGAFVSFSVSTTGDLETNNNFTFKSLTVNPFPALTFSPPPSVTKSGQQSEIKLTRDSPFPYDLTGKLLLSFTPNPAVGIDDPFVQFSSGGKVVSFSIPANSTQATFGNGGKLFMQFGSLAGTIVLGGSIDIPAPVAPKSIASQNSTIPLAVPAIVSASVDRTSGTAFVLSFYSNARNLSTVTLTFSTSPVVQISCGTTAGCSTAKNSVTFDTQDLFIAWFTDNPGYGGAATLRVPFSLGSIVTGGVQVTLTNSVGASTTTTIPLQ